MFDNAKVDVRAENDLSGWFRVILGLHQRSVLSFLSSALLLWKLLYAEDLVLMADTKEELIAREMQRKTMIRNFIKIVPPCFGWLILNCGVLLSCIKSIQVITYWRNCWDKAIFKGISNWQQLNRHCFLWLMDYVRFAMVLWVWPNPLAEVSQVINCNIDGKDRQFWSRCNLIPTAFLKNLPLLKILKITQSHWLIFTDWLVGIVTLNCHYEIQ